MEVFSIPSKFSGHNLFGREYMMTLGKNSGNSTNYCRQSVNTPVSNTKALTTCAKKLQ
jgi:hypothetical protein